MNVVRTERIWIRGSESISKLCHLSKNLYNEANFIIRQRFFKEHKIPSYYELNKELKGSENYKALPAQSAQQTLRVLIRAWKSFFRAMKEWKKHTENPKPRIPKYMKKNGEFIVIFTNQQAKIRDGYLILPKKVGLNVKTRIKKGLREVRIIPKSVGYIIEIVYEKVVDVVDETPFNPSDIPVVGTVIRLAAQKHPEAIIDVAKKVVSRSDGKPSYGKSDRN